MDLLDYLLQNIEEVLSKTRQHIYLTIIATLLASLIGVSLGILISRFKKISASVLGIVGVIQTIPSLAMLGFLLPLVGIGEVPAIIALFLYALLPIVRNTFTGIDQVESSIKEAADGMGMTAYQKLRFVELPMAFPVILAGIRTSVVINIGIATLCAFIGAGGLGDFILRGITLNNINMILAGAIPASILALVMDALLAILYKLSLTTRGRKYTLGMFIMIAGAFILPELIKEKDPNSFVAGFNSEFIERGDGFVGLDSTYNLPFSIKEMEVGLMYNALYQGDVDVIDGFSTDGRIKAFDLKILTDDKAYFPPYYAVPVISSEAARKFPEIINALKILENQITNEKMAELNYKADEFQVPVKIIAHDFLKTIGIQANEEAGFSDQPDILIGSKAFTENFILAHMFAQVIESQTSLKTGLKLGFGGTKLVFDALNANEIAIYPEYTGTGFLVILDPDEKTRKQVGGDPNKTFQYVRDQFDSIYGITVLPTLGFNNTFALMMRRAHADSLSLNTISDLADYLRK
jgi:osmoprotectant transport system permease protein